MTHQIFFYKTPQTKVVTELKFHIVTKLNKSNCNKIIKKKIIFGQKYVFDKTEKSFGKTTGHLNNL